MHFIGKINDTVKFIFLFYDRGIMNVKLSENKAGLQNQHYVLIGPYCALIGVTCLIILKAYAYYQSGSVAMMATLVDSCIDLAVSAMLLFALKLSLKPADQDHRDGHGKAEAIASLFQSAFMMGAGVFLTFEATIRFNRPVAIEHEELALMVGVIAVVVSAIIIIFQRFSLKYAPSLAIQADYQHYKVDIFLNLSVILALFIHLSGGPLWIDPLMALLISGYFIFTALDILRGSFDMLMDKELSEEVRQDIIRKVNEFDAIHGLHDLRTRQSGMKIHISFDVELNPDMSLREAHDIVRDIEHALIADYPNADILIHMDPVGDTHDTRHQVMGVHD